MKVVLEHLTKIFPSRDKKSDKQVIAVNDFTFEIPDGKLVGLLGPSGCGKSTTLYMICGLQKPTGGKIFFGEDDVTDLSPENRGVGLVFQNYALYPHMTVRQNILFPLQNLKGEDKLTKAQMLERALEAARLVQIDELLDRKPSELSGGQQQRVAIARALVNVYLPMVQISLKLTQVFVVDHTVVVDVTGGVLRSAANVAVHILGVVIDVVCKRFASSAAFVASGITVTVNVVPSGRN